MTNKILELRAADDARRFLAEGLWLQRIVPARAETVAEALEWAHAIASEGEPVPPIGFIADVGHMIFRASTGVMPETGLAPCWPANVNRLYEDHVLGKLFADSAFERAGDALRPYQGRDRTKGLAFLLGQMRQCIDGPGVLLSPGVVKSLRDLDPEELLREGWESLQEHGPMPLLIEMYQSLAASMRNAHALIGPEDIFELERRTAIAQFGQRLALRQVLQAAERLAAPLPRQKPRPASRRHDVPTHLLEEDTYPVGGFASISTRGTIESLLHSQLAFMEAAAERPDLFDIKFLRDELLYYSRDENSFLRRRRTFVFALYSDLIHARVKDPELPFQRIILLLGLLFAASHRLIDWLSSDALQFEIIFVEAKDAPALAAEKELLHVLLAEQIANGTAAIETLTADALAPRCMQRAQRSLVQVLTASTRDQPLDADGIQVSRLVLADPPLLGLAGEPPQRVNADSAFANWSACLEQLLAAWV